MNTASHQWPFVIAAYSLVITVTLIALFGSWYQMRRAEKRLMKLSRAKKDSPRKV
ncbi:hypothetical protein [Zymomonas mobilis]|uniref:hypothetical protein n=1 Tax=Zymomonas mobilis TaxID=542 RepID=UPI0003C73CEF|nr:hypothetical protein [Zymomonas mobilis]AHB09418.1 hypothetical protein ZCP4_0080 [Zymomonas mobilis subsp. mobilis str. CP4 = NRRL B-14023]AHJ69724.1 hypothetical protein A254_00080 [Zymomonas mobilis subsp. mobilis NRRL B-12526]AHJ71580.1 hypothetical protein A265_00080 [Zymomonas mobilis subsp. mobilis str. CP4 = NRRL B-14023]MCP9307844.1 hypothetical protein [Zymomonas mobilis]TWE24283.1 hypothetical protein FBY52_1173 [Zymomonas mobilis]